VALIAATTLLAGCTGEPGAAAIVNGVAISEADLLQSTKQLQDASLQVTANQVLTVLVIADKTLAAAQKTGAWKPDAAFEAELEKIPGATALTRKALMASSAIGALPAEEQQAIIASASSGSVQINPRFGAFDAQAGITAIVPNWIKPAPTASVAK
jgi:hypothetical protein